MGKSKIKDLNPQFNKSGVNYSAFIEIQNLLANAIKISNNLLTPKYRYFFIEISWVKYSVLLSIQTQLLYINISFT